VQTTTVIGGQFSSVNMHVSVWKPLTGRSCNYKCFVSDNGGYLSLVIGLGGLHLGLVQARNS